MTGMSKISDADPRPPYVQIADHLRAAIDSGELAEGQRLPSGRALADQYGVAAMTVQHALRLLRDEGRIASWQGRGVFVTGTKADAAHSDSSQSDDIAGRLDQVAEDTSSTRQQLADLTERVAHTDDVEALRSEVADLRKQVGTLQGQLMDLYARTGHEYPRASRESDRQRTSARRKAAGA